MCVLDEWRQKAFDTLRSWEVRRRSRDQFRATYDMLKREYPDSYWILIASEQRSGYGNRWNYEYSTMSNGGIEAMERGWEEEEAWEDVEARSLGGRERLRTVYIWRSLKSHYGSQLREATDEEEEKVYEIIDRLKEKEERELDSFSGEEKKENRWSCERLRDELIQQMNNTPQLNKWKHFIVSNDSTDVWSDVNTTNFYASTLYFEIKLCFQS